MHIKLTTAQQEKCEEHGRRVATSYGAGNKDKSKKLAIPGKPPIHNDSNAQAYGRMAEMAFVIAANLSDDYLNWTDRCDGSSDIKLPGLTIDVKSSSNPRAERLMWPVTKNHFFESAAADILVLAKVRTRKNPVEVEFLGWVGKKTFQNKHRASKKEKGIIDGTMYMYQSRLNDMEDLFHIIKIAMTNRAET